MWPKPHNFIPLAFRNCDNYLEKVAELYKSGLSLRDVGNQVGLSRTQVRNLVLRAGIPLRPSVNETGPIKFGKQNKRPVKPPYGFMYFEGHIVKHPKEYPVLLSIIKKWKLGGSYNSIAVKLNAKRVPSPLRKKWSDKTIAIIIQRVKTGHLVQKGDSYELR